MSVKVSKKHNSLCISTKIEIIQRLRKGETTADLSRIYNVPRTTISTFKHNGDKMEDFLRKMESTNCSALKRKRLKRASNTLLDEVMFHWYLQQKSFGLSINGPMIIQKALTVNQQLKGDPNFKASSGWLDKFKSRHGIRFNTTESDDKLSAASPCSNDKDDIKVKEEIGNSDEDVEDSFNTAETVKAVQNLRKNSVDNVSKNDRPDDVTKISCDVSKDGRTKLGKIKEGKNNNKEVKSSSSIITHKEAEVMLAKCIEWYEKQDESRPSEIMLLKEIQDLAEAKSKQFLNSFT